MSAISKDLPALSFTKRYTIKDIQFTGVHRTNKNLLRKIVADSFQTGTITDLIESRAELEEKLIKLNAFTDVDIEFIHLSDNEFDYRISVKERGRIGGSLKTEVDSNPSGYSNCHAMISAKLPNLTGFGDEIEFLTKFNRRYQNFGSRYSVPLAPWRKFFAPKYSLSCNFDTWEHFPSQYSKRNKGISNSIEFYSSEYLNHAISFDNVWREIKASSNKTPVFIQEFSGHTCKSSIRYILRRDTRSDNQFPFNGNLFKFCSEVATDLVGGGMKFTKHEFAAQINKPVSKSEILLQLNLFGGLMNPFKSTICDRFFLGDPLRMRGFKFNGLGPSENECPKGGDMYFIAGLHFYPLMPYSRQISHVIRPQIFMNSGTIGDWADFNIPRSLENLKDSFDTFSKSLRYSCGIGLVALLGRARLELNYCYNIAHQPCDLLDGSIQFGFGINE